MNIETLLPCGEKLKPLLKDSIISNSELKEMLKHRGVFISDNEKANCISFLTLSPISPNEFENLQELQKKKEDNIKQRNYTIPCLTEKNLAGVIPQVDFIKPESIRSEQDNFNFKTDLNLAIDNTNSVYVEYEIERDDITRDWARISSVHTGHVAIKKDDGDNSIRFTSEFTSSETHAINESIIKSLKNKFIADGIVDNGKLQTISSDSFGNKARFEFMLSFANDSPNFLKFKEIYNLEIGPAEDIELSKDINWISKNIKNMIINGNKLQEIEQLTNPQNYDSLILRELQAKYEFKFGLFQGWCIISFGFPHYFRKGSNNKDFEVSVPRIYFNKNSMSENRTNAIRGILSEFDLLKNDNYKAIMDKATTM